MNPQDVAMLRREQINWLDTFGEYFFNHTILVGSQTLHPNLELGRENAVRILTREERIRLSRADMWYVDQNTCHLVSEAYGTMPAFKIQRHDLPSRYGFVVFDEPIMAKQLDMRHEEFFTGAVKMLLDDIGYDFVPRVSLQEFVQLIIADPSGVAATMGLSPERQQYVVDYIDRAKKIRGLGSGIMHVRAISWGDHSLDRGLDGTWMTFYVNTEVTDVSGREKIENITPLKMIIEGEMFINWSNGQRIGGDEGTYDWFKMLLATFRLASQRNLCDETIERTSRAERRRCQRDNLGCSDIRVVRLRSGSNRPAEPGKGREYSCRWRVAGHWRQQWYATKEEHRPIWIMDHVKGPDDKPFRGGERVKIV